jgi:hypothetical protein
MRGYSAPVLRLTRRAVSSIMIVSYVLWAWSELHPKTRSGT